jgi:hypothetical protein
MDALRFLPGDLGVLFFSRGRGRVHAESDIAISGELTRLRAGARIRFASYGTGVEVFNEAGIGVIDLGLPEQNDPIETLVLSARVIGYMRPKLVVAHEEFAALPAAKVPGTPAVLVTDWFAEDTNFGMSLLSYADEILFLDKKGVYEEPTQAEGRVRYASPVLRDFTCKTADRTHARHELGLPADATVVSVIVPPGRRIERVAPVFDAVLDAFLLLPSAPKRLVWLAGEDAEVLRIATRGLQDVIVKENEQPFDRLMVASDLAITKGNRNIVMELAVLGIPTISITHHLNRIDDFRTPQIDTNKTVPFEDLDAARLCKLMQENLAAGSRRSNDFGDWKDGRSDVAQRLAEILSTLAH